MQKILLLDNDFLSRAWAIGGKSYLDQMENLARLDGYALVVTDVVADEIRRGPNGTGIQAWLDSKGIASVQTQESLPYSRFQESKLAGTVARDAKYSSPTLGLDGGDASILERMRAEKKAGNVVAVASDDGFFRGVPTKGGQSIKGFGFEPSAITLSTPDLINQVGVRGNLTSEQRANISKLPVFDPTNPSYSKTLSGKLLSDAEVMRVMKDGTTTTTTILSKLGAGLKFLGLAGLIYDIGTSSAEAAQAAGKGDAGRASEVMAQLAARTYGGLQLGLAGGALAGAMLAGTPVAIAGILVGGIVGGVIGGAAGDALVERIWGAARQAIKLLGYGDIDGKVGHFRQVEQDLAARNMPADIAKLVALGLNDGTLVNADSVQARQDYLKQFSDTSAGNGNARTDGDLVLRYVSRGPDSSIVTMVEAGRDITVNQNGKVIEEREYGQNGVTGVRTIDEWAGDAVARYSTSVYAPDGRLVKTTDVTPDGRVERYYDPNTGRRVLEKHYDDKGALIPPEVVKARDEAEERKRWESIAADRIAAEAERERERKRAEEARIAAGNPPTQAGGQESGGGPGGALGGGVIRLPLPTFPSGGSVPPTDDGIIVLPPVRVYWNDPDFDEALRQAAGNWEAALQLMGAHGGGPSGAPPVVLDLDRNGVFDIRPYTDQPLDMAGPRFDFDGDGIPDRTAWVGPGDGFLVIDRGAGLGPEADGRIDQPQELAFAQWKTPQAWQAELAAQPPGAGIDKITDLSALRLLFDSNHDGVLDGTDEQWRAFRVWQDLDQDGTATPDELKTLDLAGISAIGLVPDTESAVRYADGSEISGTSRARMADGSQMLVGDLTLRFQPSAVRRPEPAASAGGESADAKLEGLVAAMAGFAPPASGGLALPTHGVGLPLSVVAASLQ
jgi:hypothetical protein